MPKWPTITWNSAAYVIENVILLIYVLNIRYWNLYKRILHVILPKKHPCHVNLWTFTSFSYPIPISTTILPWQPLFDYFYTCIGNVNHLKYHCRCHLKSHFIDIHSQNHVFKPCRMNSAYNFMSMTLLSTIFTWKLYLLHTMIDKITTSCVSLHID